MVRPLGMVEVVMERLPAKFYCVQACGDDAAACDVLMYGGEAMCKM